jgi:hypothetical protein
MKEVIFLRDVRVVSRLVVEVVVAPQILVSLFLLVIVFLVLFRLMKVL